MPPFDPTSADFAANPYDVYAELRSRDAPYYYEAMDAFLLSRYEDVDSAARDARLVRSLEAFLPPAEVAHQRRLANWDNMPNHARFVQFSLLDSDGEVHRRLRTIVLRELSRRFVEQQRAAIEATVTRLLDQLLELKEIDFIADLAAHVPGHVIGHVLGVPDADCPQLRAWSEDVVQFFDVARTEEHKQQAETATTEFYEYLETLIAAREAAPRDDLVSTLIAARRAGDMTETELISTCMLILMAGHGSTIDVLGTGLLTLIRHPEAVRQLREAPGLMGSAVQEMFRFEAPLPFFHRYASEAVEVLGTVYPEGTKFGLLYGAANRDDTAFPDADRFDIHRAPNRHLAFGRGAHLCLGNHLARLDMEVIFNTLLARTRSIELVDPAPAFKRSLSVRGLESLDVRLVPA